MKKINRYVYDKNVIDMAIKETNSISGAAKKLKIPGERLYQWIRSNGTIKIKKTINIDWF